MPKKELIWTDKAPRPKVPIAQAVRFGDLVFTSVTWRWIPRRETSPEGTSARRRGGSLKPWGRFSRRPGHPSTMCSS